jgi:hypothetical protein
MKRVSYFVELKLQVFENITFSNAEIALLKKD